MLNVMSRSRKGGGCARRRRELPNRNWPHLSRSCRAPAADRDQLLSPRQTSPAQTQTAFVSFRQKRRAFKSSVFIPPCADRHRKRHSHPRILHDGPSESLTSLPTTIVAAPRRTCRAHQQPPSDASLIRDATRRTTRLNDKLEYPTSDRDEYPDDHHRETLVAADTDTPPLA